MKITAFIALWKRPEITRICFEGLERLREYSKHDISVFCVVSERKSADLCREYGYDFIYSQNYPVGQKFNNGMKGLLETDFDFCLQMNSDTLLANELLDVYEPYFEFDYFGVDEVHFIDTNTGRCLYMKYDNYDVLGCGRVISKKALKDVWGKTKGEIWRPDVNKGLDNHSDFNMTRNGYQVKKVYLGGSPYTVDLKSEVNIWGFDFFLEKAEARDVSYLESFYPELCHLKQESLIGG